MSKQKPLSEKVVKGGRPIRLNRVHLEPRPDRDYAELIFWGDVHWGHPGCNVRRAQSMLDYCLENKVYILGMGDYIEAGLRESVGDSVYIQEFNPDKQAEQMVGLLMPLAKAGLLIGMLRGNHEARISKETSVDITKWMARVLDVPYLGAACWNLLYVGSQSYTLYALHGSTGSRFIHTKLKAVTDISHNFDADIIAMGHVHELADDWLIVQQVSRTRKVVAERKKILLLTGHYLNYDDSYAQEKGYGVGKQGSPKLKLFSEKSDLHAST